MANVTHVFAWEFTKGTAKVAPANAPTVQVFDAKNPTGALLSSGNAVAVTNCAGYYTYSYTGADTEVPIANCNTADTTVTMQDLGSWPIPALDTNGHVLSTVADYTANMIPLQPITTGRQIAVDASGRVDLGEWIGSVPDALSSGKIPADIKLWLASAPASLSTNGYVQSLLMRWLTDNAAGTPNALSTNNIPADVKLWLTGTPDALSSGKIPADLKLWLASAPLALSSQLVQAIIANYATGQDPATLVLGAPVPDSYTSGEVGYVLGHLADGTVTVVSAVSGGIINVYRGTTWTIPLTIGNITGRSKLWFTVKNSTADPDSSAIVQIEETDGLKVLNGSTSVTTSDGAISVTTASTGDITITLKPASSVKIGQYISVNYDVKVLIGTTITEMADGRSKFNVLGVSTMAVS